MAESIRDILFRIAPEFETSNPDELAKIDLFIEDAKCDVPVSKLGKKADRAVAYYTAHLLTCIGNDGVISQEKIGDESVSYAIDRNDINSTKYLRTYERMTANLIRFSPFVLDGKC